MRSRLHQAGVLALNATSLSWHDLAQGGCVVEAPLQCWQLGCQVPHA